MDLSSTKKEEIISCPEEISSFIKSNTIKKDIKLNLEIKTEIKKDEESMLLPSNNNGNTSRRESLSQQNQVYKRSARSSLNMKRDPKVLKSQKNSISKDATTNTMIYKIGATTALTEEMTNLDVLAGLDEYNPHSLKLKNISNNISTPIDENDNPQYHYNNLSQKIMQKVLVKSNLGTQSQTGSIIPSIPNKAKFYDFGLHFENKQYSKLELPSLNLTTDRGRQSIADIIMNNNNNNHHHHGSGSGGGGYGNVGLNLSNMAKRDDTNKKGFPLVNISRIKRHIHKLENELKSPPKLTNNPLEYGHNNKRAMKKSKSIGQFFDRNLNLQKNLPVKNIPHYGDVIIKRQQQQQHGLIPMKNEESLTNLNFRNQKIFRIYKNQTFNFADHTFSKTRNNSKNGTPEPQSKRNK